MSQCFDVIFYVLFLLPSFKPEFFFENFKFEFYNLIRLSYLIFCCKRTKSWTSSLRKSVLILTRSDFEEVNVVTCWDKKKCDSYHLTVASQNDQCKTKAFCPRLFRAIKTFWNFPPEVWPEVDRRYYFWSTLQQHFHRLVVFKSSPKRAS